MKSKFFNTPCCVLFIGLLAFSSCKKDKPYSGIPSPLIVNMEYFDFNNHEIKANTSGFSVDVNHDGRKDIAFTTLLVGDPINQVDKLQFLVQSNIKVNLPVNVEDEIPVMELGDSIPINNFNEYHWFELTSIILLQKVISFTQPPIWEGRWKNAVNKYVPFQILDNDKIYNGWIQISLDIINEKLIIHKGAISKESNKTVKAGI